MTQGDVPTILQRLDRIAHAIELGTDAMASGRRPAVAVALVDTAWEAVHLGHVLTQSVAYDDIWDDLDGLLDLWRRIEVLGRHVEAVAPDGVRALTTASETRQTIQEIRQAVAVIDVAQVEIIVDADDLAAWGRLLVAAEDLESAADRNFMVAVADDVQGRLDAGLALLTTCAARASRERTLARPKR